MRTHLVGVATGPPNVILSGASACKVDWERAAILSEAKDLVFGHDLD